MSFFFVFDLVDLDEPGGGGPPAVLRFLPAILQNGYARAKLDEKDEGVRYR